MLSERFNALSQQIFQKKLEDCSVEELESLAHEYPYFAPAQYILLARLKDADYSRHESQLQKSILYYHDPLAFDHFINTGDYNVDFDDLQIAEEPLPPATEETIIEESPEEIVEVSEFSEQSVPELSEPILDVPETSDEIHHEVESIEIPIAAPLVEDVKDEAAEEEEINSLDSENEVVSEIEEEKPITQNIPPSPLVKIEETQTGTGLAFEPYHTVDYFASQGIKLSQEEATGDKFGKQLKSFTEWLKTMKRIPATEQVKPLDAGSEQKVENLAAHSVEGENVYTETMAEVWVQQGNKEKAKEVYNKLSLLNPSKRAYFAAKIDSLK